MLNLAEVLSRTLRSYVTPPLWSRDPALKAYLGYSPTASGTTVNEATALNLSAYWRGVNLIADSVASLPLFLYRRVGENGKELFRNHPVYALIHDDFSDDDPSFQARRRMQAHALTWGNGYAEIERDNAGRPLALHPITPDRVTPDRDSAGIFYRVQNARGDVHVAADDMLHVPGLGYDGLRGYSVVQMARESLGLGLATERYGSKFFGNGAVASIVAKHPGQLSPDAHNNLKRDLEQKLTGDRQHSLILLEENMTIDKMSIPPDDAQFLETRKFQVVEIARWLGVPPHMLMEMDRATFSNIEHQSLEFVIYCLRAWLIAWEAELERKLIRPLERNQQFIKHSVDGLLRGDIKTRFEAYAIGRQWGWVSPDDVRELEDMNPLPKGQGRVYLVPINMLPADRIQEWADKQVAIPAPPQPPAPAPPDQPAPQRSAPDIEARARIIAAQRALVVEAMGRMVRREGQAAKRAAKKGQDALVAWALDFYPKHFDIMREALEPAMRSHLSQIGSDANPVAETARVALAYCEQSRAELAALDSVDLVDQLVTRWEIQRPPQMADVLMAEEITHAHRS